MTITLRPPQPTPLTINKATDAISFPQPTAMVTFGEAPSTPQAATTVSGVGTITYASNNEDDATVNNDGLVHHSRRRGSHH